ncbi:MAG: HNH endonuclease [Candidatus Aminicenantes bacterium]|nr:HNH endonuclease [Candidatus Aminicenantes bacterium]MDH5384744.1 HNH endonuclease [Candidatus Aminicenantes bacterium]
MNFFIGITDQAWFDYLSSLPSPDEVNFWQPSGRNTFRALQPGELFLFKLHSPNDYIVGGGFFVHSTLLPISLAWEAFQEKNGANSLLEMRQRIAKYRRTEDLVEDFTIGCILLEQPFFLDESEWIPIPEWSPNIVRGKRVEMDSEEGKYLWSKLQLLLSKRQLTQEPDLRTEEERTRYGKETLIRPRLGQGSFRILVTDAYLRSCAITQERVLPVLEAAHIKPYSDDGPHEVRNGVLLRSDMHKLFERGYLTITPKLHIEVSRRIKDEFDNGKYYFTFHGQQINLPRRPVDQPSIEFLSWHNEKKFKG